MPYREGPHYPGLWQRNLTLTRFLWSQARFSTGTRNSGIKEREKRHKIFEFISYKVLIISLTFLVCKSIVGRLSSAVAQQNDVSVQLEALDILGDLLSRFGGLLLVFHPNILEALSPQLKSPRLAVRKR